MKLQTIILSLTIMSIFLPSCKITNHASEAEVKESFVLSDTMLKSTTFTETKIEPLRNELKLFGKITTDNNKLIEVFPVVGGNVTNVYAELGDYVEKGKILARIKSTEVAGYEKDLIDAKNDVLVAKNNLKVAQELFDGKLNTERDVLEAKSQLEKVQSQLNRIEEIYKIYRLSGNSSYEVRAPISGFIIQKNINQDMQLRSDHTDNIFDIAEINEVWVLANVNESDIGQIKLGVEAEVTTISYPDKKFIGKVDKIFNIIDPDTKAMKIRIKLDNKGYLLKPEMRATVTLNFEEEKKMTCIPTESVIFDRSKSYVIVFKDRYNVETRLVNVFRQVGDRTYLTSGLKEGEKVVTKNQLLIYDALND